MRRKITKELNEIIWLKEIQHVLDPIDRRKQDLLMIQIIKMLDYKKQKEVSLSKRKMLVQESLEDCPKTIFCQVDRGICCLKQGFHELIYQHFLEVF